MKSGRTLKRRSKPRHTRVTTHVRVRKSAATAAPASAAAAARRTRRMRKGGGGSGTRKMRGNPFITVFKKIRDTLNPNQYRVAPAELPSTRGMPLVNKKKSGIRNFFLNLGKTKANKQVVVPSAESSRLLSPSAELPSAQLPSAQLPSAVSSRVLSPGQRLAATPPFNSDSPEQTILYERPPPKAKAKAKVIKVQPNILDAEKIENIKFIKQTFIDKLNAYETLPRDVYKTLFDYLDFVYNNLEEIQRKLPNENFSSQNIIYLVNQLKQKEPIDEDTISSDGHVEDPYTPLKLPEVPTEDPKSIIKLVKFTLNTIYNIMLVFVSKSTHMYNNEIKLRFNYGTYDTITYNLFNTKIFPVMNAIAITTGERDKLKAVQLESIIKFFISYLNLKNPSMVYVNTVYDALSDKGLNIANNRVINKEGPGALLPETFDPSPDDKKIQLLALLEEMNTFVNDIINLPTLIV